MIPDPWMNDGWPERKTARLGAEVIGSKDLTCVHHSVHRFISVLVLDGLLERHRQLRGGVIDVTRYRRWAASCASAEEGALRSATPR